MMEINDELVSVFLDAYRDSFYNLEEAETVATRKGLAAFVDRVQEASAEADESARITRALDQEEAVLLQGVLMKDYILYRPIDGGGLMSWAANALKYRPGAQSAPPVVAAHDYRHPGSLPPVSLRESIRRRGQ